MIICIAAYAICNLAFGINELVANVISWILSVLFAFYTNRIWVFRATTNSIRSFFGGGNKRFTSAAQELRH